jgi:hypothetical protein
MWWLRMRYFRPIMNTHTPRSLLLHHDVGSKHPLVRVQPERDLFGDAVERVDVPEEQGGEFLFDDVESLVQQ